MTQFDSTLGVFADQNNNKTTVALKEIVLVPTMPNMLRKTSDSSNGYPLVLSVCAS